MYAEPAQAKVKQNANLQFPDCYKLAIRAGKVKRTHAKDALRKPRLAYLTRRPPILPSRHDLMTPEHPQVPGGVASPPNAVAIF